jgi:hypothetical protein
MFELIPLALQIVGAISGGSSTASVVGSTAGSIIKMLAGDKAGDVASKIIDTAKSVFGTSDPAEIARHAAADKSKADLALAQINKDLEIFRIEVADTQDARKQTVALAQAGSAIAWGPVVISSIVVVGYFIVLVMLIARPIQISSDFKDVLLVLFGALQTGFGQVCNYWLGSSRGSSDKDASMQALLLAHANSNVVPLKRAA